MVMITYIGSVYYSFQTAWMNRNHLYAIQIVSYYEGKILASDFDKLGNPAVVSGDYEYDFKDTVDVKPDSAAETSVPVYTVDFIHMGWGGVASATNTTLVANFASNQDEWEPDVWKGHFVCIAKGTGVGQIMRITGNTEDTLTVTREMDGSKSTEWATVPDSTSEYLIDNGKHVRIRVSWRNSNLTATKDAEAPKDKNMTRTVLLERI